MALKMRLDKNDVPDIKPVGSVGLYQLTRTLLVFHHNKNQQDNLCILIGQKYLDRFLVHMA